MLNAAALSYPTARATSLLLSPSVSSDSDASMRLCRRHAARLKPVSSTNKRSNVRKLAPPTSAATSSSARPSSGRLVKCSASLRARSLFGFGLLPDLYAPVRGADTKVQLYIRIPPDTSVDAARGRLQLLGAELDKAMPERDFKYAEYIHYRPPANFVGTDTFQFVATDPSGLSVTNEVTIRVQAESLWFNPLKSILRVAGNEPPRLHLDGVRTNAAVILYATLDFALWMPIATNTSVTGTVEFPISPNGLRQFYRAVQTMP